MVRVGKSVERQTRRRGMQKKHLRGDKVAWRHDVKCLPVESMTGSKSDEYFELELV